LLLGDLQFFAGSLDGVDLPKNVFWAGAINPVNIATTRLLTTLPGLVNPNRHAHAGLTRTSESSLTGFSSAKALTLAPLQPDIGAAAPGRHVIDHTGTHSSHDMSDFVVREMPLALQVCLHAVFSD
jgi:hypothetical protein